MNPRTTSGDEPQADDLAAMRDEVRDDRQRLVAELKDIDLQLSNPNRVDPQTGDRLTGDDYWEWRYAAARAKRQKEKDLAGVNGLIAQLNREIRDAPRPPGSRSVSPVEAKIDLLLDHFGIEWGGEES